MRSTIAHAIKLKTLPVAVLLTDRKPERAIQFKAAEAAPGHGRIGCVISMLKAAANGRTAVFDENTCGCPGGAVGLGFKEQQFGYIEYFLSSGKEGEIEGEYRKKTPELARQYLQSLPEVDTHTRYVVMTPLEQVADDAVSEVALVIFLANPDQLSALATLANFDRASNDNVITLFGSGCSSVVRQVLAQARSKEPKAVIGLTDITARQYLDKDVLSFSIPFDRFLEMEANVYVSFLTKGEDWARIMKRL
ncbi:MAG: DUF169 domain-containing protein [Halobacteriota archaeon]